MVRTILLSVSMLAIGAGVRTFESPVEPRHSSTEAVHGPPSATPLTPVAKAHAGDALCIHYDVLPVSKFYDHYQDGLGHHYHGWQPPAGAPFYVACPFRPEE